MIDDLKFELIIEQLDRIEKRIKSDFPNWLSVEKCADYLDVSKSTIRKMVTAGSIPYRRLPTADGGKLLFNRRQIDLFLLTGNQRPNKRARQTFEELL
jgi:excisionase family DNA binding protein